MKVFLGFIALILSMAIFMAALFIPSFMIQFSVDRLFDKKLDIFGIYMALISLLTIKVMYFSSSDKNE